MVQLGWMTDIHLNFLAMPQIDAWLEIIGGDNPDILVITGDIGEAHTVADYLIRMVKRLDIPIYFVLGNHDYYNGLHYSF